MKVKQTNSDLFDLIKSLTPSEKRYFSIYSKRHVIGESNNYVKLFNAIEKQDEYNEGKILKKFKGTKIAKHFSPSKTQLYGLILKSMRSFHEEKSLNSKLSNLLLDIEFLYARGLYKKSLKYIKKVKTLGKENSKDHFVLIASHFERKIKRFLQKKMDAENFIENDILELELIKQITKHQKVIQLYDKINFLALKNYQLNDESLKANLTLLENALESIEVDHSIQDENLFFFLLSKMELLQLKGDKDGSHETMREMVKLFDGNENFKKEEKIKYLNILNNYLNSCFMKKEYEDFPYILQQMKSIEANNFTEKATIFKNVYYQELLYFLNTSQFNKAEACVPEIEKGLIEYDKKIRVSRKLVTYYNIMVLYFILNDQDKAMYWMNKILGYENTAHRIDLQNAAKLFELIFHYEMENVTVLDNLTRSVDRKFKQVSSSESFNKDFVGLIKQCNNKPKNQHRSIFTNYLTQLEGKYLNVIGRDEIVFWVKSKIQNQPITAVIAN